MPDFVTPPPASPGAEVAVIAPTSGGAAEARHVLDLALDRLSEAFGLQPRLHRADSITRETPAVRRPRAPGSG